MPCKSLRASKHRLDRPSAANHSSGDFVALKRDVIVLVDGAGVGFDRDLHKFPLTQSGRPSGQFLIRLKPPKSRIVFIDDLDASYVLDRAKNSIWVVAPCIPLEFADVTVGFDVNAQTILALDQIPYTTFAHAKSLKQREKFIRHHTSEHPKFRRHFVVLLCFNAARLVALKRHAIVLGRLGGHPLKRTTSCPNLCYGGLLQIAETRSSLSFLSSWPDDPAASATRHRN
jgi:hypothetical protein